MNIGEKTPHSSGSITIGFYRLKAQEFKSQNRYEKSNENLTMFTQMLNGYKNKYSRLRRNDKRPLSVTFKGEAAQDCGGPMRDVISNVCEELMSSVLPLLIPTSNNIAKVEPATDCVKLNPHATEAFLLRKYSFLGYFLGWSMRGMGGLGIDLVPAFWNRVCGGPTYVYTLEDLRSMDIYRFDILTAYKNDAEIRSDEEFTAVYDSYFFDAVFDGDSDPKELCEGGSAI